MRYCQSAMPAGDLPVEQFNDKYKKTLYNFSLSHKFTEDLLVYATTGSSFRTGLPALNNAGLPANLLLPNRRSAKSYELGVKASFGRQLRINAAVFQLDYENQLTRFEGCLVPELRPKSGAAAQPVLPSIAISMQGFAGLSSMSRPGLPTA